LFFYSNLPIIFYFFYFSNNYLPADLNLQSKSITNWIFNPCLSIWKTLFYKTIFYLPQYSKKAFSFYKHYLSFEKQVKWRSSFLVSKRSCQPNTAAWYFYLFFKVYQAAILPYGFLLQQAIQRAVTEPVEVQKPVMPFAVPSSVVTAALSVL
jgi:hypothetical protein